MIAGVRPSWARSEDRFDVSLLPVDRTKIPIAIPLGLPELPAGFPLGGGVTTPGEAEPCEVLDGEPEVVEVEDRADLSVPRDALQAGITASKASAAAETQNWTDGRRVLTVNSFYDRRRGGASSGRLRSALTWQLGTLHPSRLVGRMSRRLGPSVALYPS